MKIILNFESREDLMRYVTLFKSDVPFALLMKDLDGTDGGYDIRTNILMLHIHLTEVEMAELFKVKLAKHPVDGRTITSVTIRDTRGWLHLSSKPPLELPKPFLITEEGGEYYWKRENEFGEAVRFGPFNRMADATTFAANNGMRTR